MIPLVLLKGMTLNEALGENIYWVGLLSPFDMVVENITSHCSVPLASPFWNHMCLVVLD